MADRERDPWEKRPTETSRAYEAFRAYRDLGPMRRWEDVPGHPSATVRKWHGRHQWRTRADAWDAEAHRMEDTRRLELIRSMDDTHQRAARVLIQTALRAIAENPAALTPHQAARYLDLGTRLERAALLADHLPPVGAAVDGDDDDLSPLERIARELAGLGT